MAARGIRVFHRDQPTAIVPMIARDARLIVWAGVGAYSANMNYVDMQAGERNKDHVHPESEDTIYVLDGKGSVQDLTNGRPAGVRGRGCGSCAGRESGTRCRETVTTTSKAWAARARPIGTCCG